MTERITPTTRETFALLKRTTGGELPGSCLHPFLTLLHPRRGAQTQRGEDKASRVARNSYSLICSYSWCGRQMCNFEYSACVHDIMKMILPLSRPPE